MTYRSRSSQAFLNHPRSLSNQPGLSDSVCLGGGVVLVGLFLFWVLGFWLCVVVFFFGVFLWFLIGSFIPISMVVGLVLVGIMGAVGYVIGAVTIPDSPVMGPLRKAGGENISDILLRLIAFRGKRSLPIL